MQTYAERQAENDGLVAEVRKLLETGFCLPTAYLGLYMNANACVGSRGLHINNGLGRDHYVHEGIRDPFVLAEIVRSYVTGHNDGTKDGMNMCEQRQREAMGVYEDDEGYLRISKH